MIIKNQQGKITTLILFIVVFLLIAKIFAPKFVKNSTNANLTTINYEEVGEGCLRYNGPPITFQNFGYIKKVPQSEMIKDPKTGEDIIPDKYQPLTKDVILDKSIPINYKLILRNVPVKFDYITENKKGFLETGQISKKYGVTLAQKIIISNTKYSVVYPKIHGEIHFPSNQKARQVLGNKPEIEPYAYGLIFMVKLEGDSPILFNGKDLGTNGTFILTDVFQDPSKPPLPDAAADTCQGKFNRDAKEPLTQEDLDDIATDPEATQSSDLANTSIIYPPQASSPDKNELQLEYFLFKGKVITTGKGAWNVHCKPAIYLYPKNKTLFNVKVFPKGELTYTDPKYPNSTGWNGLAYPDGSIEVNNKLYPYLYYEAKIRDDLIQIPENGYVIQQSGLEMLLDQLLPKLGLSEKEATEFKDYWLKSLPNSSYYFVGILPQDHIDFLESLEINPKPDTNIRVHLYFKLLDQPIEVKSPTIETPKRTGFIMVEWGGMIKADPLHPFTCSQ